VVPPKEFDLRYTYLLLKSLRLDDLGKGIKPGLNRKEVYNLPIRYPGKAAQARIVAKVDELMALCDELEQRRDTAATTRRQFQVAALDRLTNAETADELDGAWARLRDNFGAVAADLGGVNSLRQAILQLAVRGQLVAQDPSEGAASKELDRTWKELGKGDQWKVIEQRINECRKNGVFENYNLPDTWCWARFGDVAEIASNLVNPKDFPDLIHLAPDNIEKGNGRLLRCNTVSEDGMISNKHKFYSGQIVYSKIRPELSKVCIPDFDGLCSADMYPINAHVFNSYLCYFMLSKVFVDQANIPANRLAMPKINQQELNKLLVPTPPLAEQHRIVAKVDELMALCDQLEQHLRQAETTAARYAEAACASLTEARAAA
jgi:type I restriction enzyme S subunit